MTMKKSAILATALAAFAAALVSGPAGAQEDGPPTPTTASASDKLDVVWNVIDGAIRPGYSAFEDAAREEASKIGALCQMPGEVELQTARDGFGDLAKAFAAIEFVRFGPITEDNRLERILFFPDRRGVTLRQVQAILADTEDDSALSADTLAQKSVAVQGLTALEFVLFGSGSETLETKDGDFRCSYAKAIADNIVSIAQAVTAGWGNEEGITRRLTNPSQSDTAYRTADDSLKAVTSIFIDGLEMIRDQRLKPALGDDVEDANPKAFLYHRSENALAALSANFSGLREVFDAAQYGEILPDAQAGYLPGAIGFEFDNARRTLDALSAPLADVVVSKENRDKLDYVLIVTGSLQSEFANQLAPALGLSAGFSSLDGD